jgi:hypothetical protein
VQPDSEKRRLTYSASVMMLLRRHSYECSYRSIEPVRGPELSGQRETFTNFPFPTGIDRRVGIDRPHRCDVQYGIIDFRIGVTRPDTQLTTPRQPRYLGTGNKTPRLRKKLESRDSVVIQGPA